MLMIYQEQQNRQRELHSSKFCLVSGIFIKKSEACFKWRRHQTVNYKGPLGFKSTWNSLAQTLGKAWLGCTNLHYSIQKFQPIILICRRGNL